jgi:hypothetical protein
MWSLSEFRFDETIDGDEVYLHLEHGEEGEVLPKGLAIDIAHARGANLVPDWPHQEVPVPCHVALVTEPVRWENAPVDPQPPVIDERLWFEASCGGRDFLSDENGHTFAGSRRWARCHPRPSTSCADSSPVASRARRTGTRAGSTRRTVSPGSRRQLASVALGAGSADGVRARSADASYFPTTTQGDAPSTRPRRRTGRDSGGQWGALSTVTVVSYLGTSVTVDVAQHR